MTENGLLFIFHFSGHLKKTKSIFYRNRDKKGHAETMNGECSKNSSETLLHERSGRTHGKKTVFCQKDPFILLTAFS